MYETNLIGIVTLATMSNKNELVAQQADIHLTDQSVMGLFKHFHCTLLVNLMASERARSLLLSVCDVTISFVSAFRGNSQLCLISFFGIALATYAQ